MTVYLTIIDECEEESRTKLLNQLKHLLHDSITTKRPIKIIITSRPHIPVTSYLADVIKLSLAAENLKDDITAFVSASVHTQLQFTGKLGDEVRQALIHGANGMFLWVSLILDDLEHSTNTTPRAIRERLQTLPSDIAGVYTNILRKIRTEDLQTAKSILQWVVWAVRPLNLQELIIAIAIRPELHASMSSMEDDMHTDLRQVLRLIFGPMLRIEDGGDTVHLVHQSAKDFLSGMSSSTKGGLSLPALVTSSVESNMQLAASCLAYLSFDECEVGPVTVRYSWNHDVRTNIGILQHKLPFLIYAAAYWPEHVRQIGTNDQHQTLCTAFRKLAESRRKIDLAYQVFMFSVSPYENFIKTNPLEIASSLGLIAFTEELLGHGADINAMGGRYGNALQGAAAEGHEAVFHQLSTRADIHITKDIVTEIARKARKGKEIMEVLFNTHPNIEITEAIVIAAAGNSGGKEVMEVLLSARPNIEITEPIVIAAAGNFGGKEVMEVMEVLLSARPNIEITEAIVTAAAGNSSGKEVIKMLLSTRPDIVITEPVVTAAAGNSMYGKEVMRLLLDNDRQFGVHPVSVQAVAYFGMLFHTQYLVSKCSKITLHEQYTNLLHAAVESGDIDILKIFLELGGNYVSPDEHNWTAYMTSSQSRNALALQKFAEMAHPSFNCVYPPAKWVSEQECVSIQLQGGGAGLLYSGKGQPRTPQLKLTWFRHICEYEMFC